MPAVREEQFQTEGTWVEGIKALSTIPINKKSASSSLLDPRICVTDSSLSYPNPQGQSQWVRTRATQSHESLPELEQYCSL